MTSLTGLSPNNPLKYLGPNVAIETIVTRNRAPTGADYRQPETGKLYPFGCLWLVGKNPTTGAFGDLWYLAYITSNVANWIMLAASAGNLITLSDDANVKVTPIAGNIQFTGHLNENSAPSATSPFLTVISTPGNHSISINPMSPARWIVDPLGGLDPLRPNGTHTSITAALASAVSGDTIEVLPGTYVEDPPLKPGVNITGLGADLFNPTVIIQGNCHLTASGNVTITGIRLETNGTSAVSIGTNISGIITLVYCYILSSAGTAVSLTSSSISSQIYVRESLWDVSVAGNAHFSLLGNGILTITNCTLYNTGGTTIADTVGSGALLMSYSQSTSPLSLTGTASLGMGYCAFSTAAQNITSLNLGGSGSQVVGYSNFDSGSASAINVTSQATIEYLTIVSSNTNAVTGNSTILGNTFLFAGASSLVNTALTRTPQAFGITGPWTPNLQINGSSAGITYSQQLGEYSVIGGICYIWASIILTSKGASTGAVTISNLPFTSNANGSAQSFAIGQYSAVTVANMSGMAMQMGTSNTVGNFVVSFNDGSVARLMVDTDIANTTILKFSGSYKVL